MAWFDQARGRSPGAILYSAEAWRSLAFTATPDLRTHLRPIRRAGGGSHGCARAEQLPSRWFHHGRRSTGRSRTTPRGKYTRNVRPLTAAEAARPAVAGAQTGATSRANSARTHRHHECALAAQQGRQSPLAIPSQLCLRTGRGRHTGDTNRRDDVSEVHAVARRTTPRTQAFRGGPPRARASQGPPRTEQR
jgi:hypothetical protein